MTNSDLVILQAKAALADDLANELRLYRGYLQQYAADSVTCRLFAPLAAYDALFGVGDAPDGMPAIP